MQIKVAARESTLSKKQVEEVLQELRVFKKNVIFSPVFTKTTGDKDQVTSLRVMGRTNFFTKEVDDLVLSGCADIGIHSAKDLPEILPVGLEVYAITKGVDPRDALVLREKDTLKNLGESPKIGTSSMRREEQVAKLLPNAVFVDIRGTIEKRLELLYDGVLDAVVIAEAALIRLGLGTINRFFLEGETAPMQGRLAVVGREKETGLKEFFQILNAT